MSRPRRPRTIEGEENLARRVRKEMDERGWSYAQLATAMTSVGCSMNRSSAHKLVNGTKKKDGSIELRAIRVDELIALAMVFDVSVENLLTGQQYLDNAEVEAAMHKLDQADHTIAEGVQQMLDAQIDLLQATEYGTEKTQEEITRTHIEWANAGAPITISPSLAQPRSEPIEPFAIDQRLTTLKAVIACIAVDWYQSERNRLLGTPWDDLDIGGQQWDQRMQYLLAYNAGLIQQVPDWVVESLEERSDRPG